MADLTSQWTTFIRWLNNPCMHRPADLQQNETLKYGRVALRLGYGGLAVAVAGVSLRSCLDPHRGSWPSGWSSGLRLPP